MPGRSKHGGGNDAMRMIYEEYYDTPKAAPRAVPDTPKATVVVHVTPKAYGGYGAKTAGASVGLPSVMPKRSVARKPSVAKRGGGDEAMAATLDNSWGSADQRRYSKK